MSRVQQLRGPAAVVLSVLALSGCGFRGAASIPLPGGAGNGSDAYEITVEFEDVLDLVEQSAVKVDDVTVGSVKSLEVDGFNARVVVSIDGDVDLPGNTRASLRQTSLLGEKFVSLDAPAASEGRGELRAGDTIPLERTERSAEIEEVLGAMSLVLNGGSLEQLQTINREVIAALEGREDRVKSVLRRLDTFVGGLDEQKAQIVRALDSLDRLTARLADDRQIIATALEEIPAGVEVLTAQREDLTRVLTSLDQLGDVAVRVIESSQANTVADLRALQPILAELNEAGDALPNALELLTTYPFPRSAAEFGMKGDYANLFLTLDADAVQLLGSVLPLPELPVPLPTLVPGGSARAGEPTPGRAPAAAPAPPTPTPTSAPTPLGASPPALPEPPLLNHRSGGLIELLMAGLL